MPMELADQQLLLLLTVVVLVQDGHGRKFSPAFPANFFPPSPPSFAQSHREINVQEIIRSSLSQHYHYCLLPSTSAVIVVGLRLVCSYCYWGPYMMAQFGLGKTTPCKGVLVAVSKQPPPLDLSQNKPPTRSAGQTVVWDILPQNMEMMLIKYFNKFNLI